MGLTDCVCTFTHVYIYIYILYIIYDRPAAGGDQSLRSFIKNPLRLLLKTNAPKATPLRSQIFRIRGTVSPARLIANNLALKHLVLDSSIERGAA